MSASSSKGKQKLVEGSQQIDTSPLPFTGTPSKESPKSITELNDQGFSNIEFPWEKVDYDTDSILSFQVRELFSIFSSKERQEQTRWDFSQASDPAQAKIVLAQVWSEMPRPITASFLTDAELLTACDKLDITRFTELIQNNHEIQKVFKENGWKLDDTSFIIFRGAFYGMVNELKDFMKDLLFSMFDVNKESIRIVPDILLPTLETIKESFDISFVSTSLLSIRNDGIIMKGTLKLRWKTPITKKGNNQLLLHVDKLQNEFMGLNFIDSNQSLDSFVGRVNFVGQLFSSSSPYFAPYFALVQTSGSGKSRTAYEYAKKNYSFYLCSREKDTDGFPLRSTICDILFPAYEKVRQWPRYSALPPTLVYPVFYGCFFAACLCHLVMNLKNPETKMTPEKWVNRQLYEQSTREFWDEVKKIQAAMFNWCMTTEDKESKFKYEYTPFILSRRLIRHYAELLSNVIDNQTTICFIFDEARAFVKDFDENPDHTFFYYLRIAMTSLYGVLDKVRFCCVVLDTFGEMMNFVPAKIPDPSLRFIKASKLFRPHIHIGRQEKFHLLEDPSDLKSITFNLRSCGRYLWAIYQQELNVAVEVAILKILGVVSVEVAKTLKPTLEQKIAILCIRGAFSFSCQEAMVFKFVQNHAATLYSISNDRTKVSFGYPTEPILSVAACAIMKMNALFQWHELLQDLKSSIYGGLSSQGNMGELVSACLWLACMDSCRQNLYDIQSPSGNAPNYTVHCSTVSVQSLLRTMYGAKCVEDVSKQLQDKNAIMLLNGTVNFNHFEYVDYAPTSSELRLFYRTFGAILCRRNFPYVDLMIPIRLENDGFSAIVVQCRNYISGNGFSIVPEDLDTAIGLRMNSVERLPLLYCFHQVGKRRTPKYFPITVSSDGKCSIQRGDEHDPDNIEVSCRSVGSSTRKKRKVVDPTIAFIGSAGIGMDIFPFLSDRDAGIFRDFAAAVKDPVAQSLEENSSSDDYKNDAIPKLLISSMGLQRHENLHRIRR